jgi:cellulose synthase/poly-beta-1,6-N-acetylglucosamine synthase-like glycosyltransferase
VRTALLAAANWYEGWVIFYLFAISTIYLLLSVTGLVDLLRRRFLQYDPLVERTTESSSLMPPVSILAPAHNEASSVCHSVRAMLGLKYPEFEVIVINDGSKDNTLALLIQEFHLYKSARFFDDTITTCPIRSVYESIDPIPLVVIDKENGGKSDALNAGLNLARYPLVCGVDADSLLEEEALLRAVRPFIYDPDRVLAVGGIVRVANGCKVTAGRVTGVNLPKSWIARFQVVEYLRAFLGGRVAFSAYNCLVVISGAFGLFSKSALLAVGGYRTDTVGEDMELVIRLHHWAHGQGRDYRIVFEPNPVCWTEVPESLATLRRQRNRWQRGTIEALWAHRKMLFRPKYGALGMAAFPYFVLFEMFGPLVELTGYILTVAGICFGFLRYEAALLFLLASISFGVLLSVGSVVLEELTLRRYPKVHDLLLLVVSSILESLGFRQLLTVWRAGAFVDVLRGRTGWGVMERKGFG